MVTPAAPASALERAVWDALHEVPDPEIPAVSVVDMGMVASVEVHDAAVRITVTPTFTGCPAVPVIEKDVAAAARALPGVEDVDVSFTFDPLWTTDRITPAGRVKLREFGLAPPTGKRPVLISEIGLPRIAVCPFCGSNDTRNENPFGPTPCRALYYCNACSNPFEQFKPV